MPTSFLEKKIVKEPGKALRRPADKVTAFDNKLKNQVQRMSFLMHQCEGIGLAANQIGLKNSVFVYTYEGKNHACVNPRYTEWPIQAAKETNEEDGSSESTEEGQENKEIGIEGCLSIPKKVMYVSRFQQIKVSYQNVVGEPLERILEGYEARLFQHEYDHLQGKLIIDYGE